MRLHEYIILHLGGIVNRKRGTFGSGIAAVLPPAIKA